MINPQIKFKSLLDGLTIEEKNKKFYELTEEGQRLEIAWDILNLVKLGVIKASFGEYWDKETEEKYHKTNMSAKELCISLNKIKSCEVCGRGALMLSRIRIGNKLSSSEFSIDGINRNKESCVEAFSVEKLYDIEDEYENSYFGHPYESNSNEKLANIMCNILVNGNFNKRDRKNYITSI